MSNDYTDQLSRKKLERLGGRLADKVTDFVHTTLQNVSQNFTV